MNNGLTTDPKDANTHLLINQHVKLCQTSMAVPIERAQKTAEKAHERTDEHDERLFRLDDPETGKVTTMWEEREDFKRSMRHYFYGMLFLVAVSAFMWLWNGFTDRDQIDTDLLVRSAVMETIKQINGGTGP